MLITDIYKKYKIMPNLQLHMFRVASVSMQIIDNIDMKVNKKEVIDACLLHDMGNIIKSDFDLFPQFLEPNGKEYWQKVKNDFITKYGNDEHHATLMIMQELQISPIIISHVINLNFSYIENTYNYGSIEEQICSYSDRRVGPLGVLSMEQRIAEGTKRFEKRNRKNKLPDDVYQKLLEYNLLLETKIFDNCKIIPSDINDDSIQKYMNTLQDYELY
jgi:hypothetical protein